MRTPTIRPATIEDLPNLTAIYNYYIEHTAITFDIEPFTVKSRRAWFDKFSDSGPYRLLVAEEEGSVLGYASSSQFRVKAAYDTSVESSIYLDHNVMGRGLGRSLYTKLFDELSGLDLHRIYAGVTLPNDASMAIHESLGFTSTAVFHEVGRKFGVYHDVCWLEKAL